MTRVIRVFISAGIAAACMCAAGCVTVPKESAGVRTAGIPEPAGLYHTVMRGQTLWRIARMYGSDVDRIASANSIQDARQLDVGRRLLIPGGVVQPSPVILKADEDFMWPVKGAVVLGFGQQTDAGLNKGLNIRPHRDMNVKAARSGTVVFYNDDFLNFGRTVIIDHGDGFLTVYAGRMDVSVRPGDVVTRGQTIALADSQAVHFEIRKGAVSQNPHFYLSQ
ncbi:MAG: peptidoglycan DD-metalloendopeptidase family protein [Candidatus Omnitrophica bacterium]|nr:peptidoglycan DD-metalloendopeptidase family protein [Candidatus Omnitrophota bacterium]MDD5775084.1 peptidoglycan DD-metalloendopeptidase family protein [Candidatus Omnitrophota bacterium]HNQ50134.1 peptidoglycan DD-metalloendopeptidase family protein [Candidatus Omnitrophota bacterium]HQO38189.1 peptidoglycan DD-metalloendopeptidase family protein [Candidatus Omnitrophota bacterium]HQQ06346.1 peptidoglycan DD-metalloendopeptidase family protein [Candidatus Omnitrophota bacterium]